MGILVGGFTFWWYIEPFLLLGVVMGLLAGLFTFFILGTNRAERLRRTLTIGLFVLTIATLLANILYWSYSTFMKWAEIWNPSYYFPGEIGLGTSPYPVPLVVPEVFYRRAEFVPELGLWQFRVPTSIDEFFLLMIPFFIIFAVFGKAFCGWLCPYGGLPEAMVTGKKQGRWQVNFLRKQTDTTGGFSYAGVKVWVNRGDLKAGTTNEKEREQVRKPTRRRRRTSLAAKAKVSNQLAKK